MLRGREAQKMEGRAGNKTVHLELLLIQIVLRSQRYICLKKAKSWAIFGPHIQHRNSPINHKDKELCGNLVSPRKEISITGYGGDAVGGTQPHVCRILPKCIT